MNNKGIIAIALLIAFGISCVAVGLGMYCRKEQKKIEDNKINLLIITNRNLEVKSER